MAFACLGIRAPHPDLMLWPERPDNWRLGAKPAQRAWVEVATAIAEFEPVTVGVNHSQFEKTRLPPAAELGPCVGAIQQRRLDT